MNANVLLMIASLFYLVLIVALYIFKEKISTFETKMYKYMLVFAVLGVIIDLIGVFTSIYVSDTSFVRWLILKMYYSYLITMMFLLSSYMFIPGNTAELPIKEKKRLQKFVIFYLVALILNLVLPVEYYKEGTIIYAYGLNTNFLYVSAGLVILTWIVDLVRNYKTIGNKKNMPMIAFIILIVPVILLQMTNPQYLLISPLISFIVVIMYHSIENPDVKLIQQLDVARDQAEKANMAKSEFLSSMSHEIRTPLNAIVGFSQALMEEELPSLAKSEVKDIIMASDSLLDIVNGILDISKIEANKLEIVNTEYSFKRIFDELVTLTKARMRDKPLDFQVQYDHSVPVVLYGDHTRLKQLVLNLLTNAVKYTPQGYVKFVISSVKLNDVCRLFISIEDSGIGIAKDKIDKLFTKFERLDIEKNNTIEGTGLGLAITKKLVELMGGKIVVQSVYGKGSKFTVAIDQKIVYTPTEVIQTDTSGKIEMFDASSKKILLVDDNMVNLKVAERLLRDYKVKIESVMSGQECLDKIISGTDYDLIFLDDMMPRMSGTQTLQNLKQIAGFTTPVVALTANAISGMKEKYLSEGFQDYLAKPIERPELHRVMKKYLDTEEETVI